MSNRHTDNYWEERRDTPPPKKRVQHKDGRHHGCIRNAAQCDTLLKCERLRASLALILSHSVKHFAADWLSCLCSWCHQTAWIQTAATFIVFLSPARSPSRRGPSAHRRSGKRCLQSGTFHHACSWEQTSSQANRPLLCHSHRGWVETTTNNYIKVKLLGWTNDRGSVSSGTPADQARPIIPSEFLLTKEKRDVEPVKRAQQDIFILFGMFPRSTDQEKVQDVPWQRGSCLSFTLHQCWGSLKWKWCFWGLFLFKIYKIVSS